MRPSTAAWYPHTRRLSVEVPQSNSMLVLVTGPAVSSDTAVGGPTSLHLTSRTAEQRPSRRDLLPPASSRKQRCRAVVDLPLGRGLRKQPQVGHVAPPLPIGTGVGVMVRSAPLARVIGVGHLVVADHMLAIRR